MMATAFQPTSFLTPTRVSSFTSSSSTSNNNNYYYRNILNGLSDERKQSAATATSSVTRLQVMTRTTLSEESESAAASSPPSNSNNNSSSSRSGITINPLVANVKVSKTVEVFGLVKQMEQEEGIKVTSLCVGEPDFAPPQAVLDATVEAVQGKGATRYTAVTGTIALRQAIATDLQQRKHVSYNPNTEILVANGAKQVVYQGVLALCGPGDTVIVPAPYWPSYPEMVRLVGATPVILETQATDGFLMTPQALRTILQEHEDTVKLLILCNPSNPTGGVHNKQRLMELAQVLQDFPRVAVLADEIYEQLVYATTDGNDDEEDPCPSFASIPGMWERTVTLNGFSKAYAMTGYRLGYAAAPTPIAKAMTTIQSQLTSCASSISQEAGVAALTQVPEPWLEANRAVMKDKRDYVLERLAAMPGVEVAVPPQGAFYVLPTIDQASADDTDFCIRLLQSKRLALVPGSSFGAPGTVRISYATSQEELVVAMDKLQEFLLL